MTPRLPDTVDHWPIDRLRAYARNPRAHSEDQIAQIAASIVEFGWTNPVLVSGDGTVIAGHGRLEAARRLGLDAVPVLVLDHLSEAQRRAYVITDNKLALNSGWNDELLAAELHALNGDGFDLSLIGFDDAEIDRLMAPLEEDEAPASEDSDEDADETPDPPCDPVSRSGDLWRLGSHRLLCGDSTDGAAVARLMDGRRASLLFTSPPYGNQRDYTTGGIGDWDKLMQGVFGQLGVVMADNGQVLVNLGLVHRDNEWQPYWGAWLDWMRSVGWRRFGLYIWDQGAGMPGDWAGRLAPAFEFVFHFNRQSRKPNKIVPCKTAGEVGHAPGSAGMRRKDSSFNAWTHGGQPTQDFRIPDSVIRIERHHGAVGRDLSHPAPFPVKLVEHVMLAFSDTDAIAYEPFGGSGTTIIAGERAGRQVRAIELAPEYVDVALLRWRQLYPTSAVTLDGDGRRFEEIAADRGVEIKDAA